MRFWQSSSLHLWTQLHYVLIEYSPSVWLANTQKTVVKQLTCDLTLSKLTCTAHGNNLFHWTLINLLSPTSINENITYVYILKAKNSTPNLTSHLHPQVKLIAKVSPAHYVLVWTQDLFVVPRTQKGSIPVNGHHPAPNPSYILPQTRQKSQHNLKLCKNNATLFWRYIACKKSQHTLKLCKNYFEGTSHAQKSDTPSSCVRTMHQLVQALPTPQTPTVLWTDVSKPAGTSLEDSTSAMGPYCRQYKSTLYSLFSLTAQLGHILVVPKHNFFVSCYKRFGRVMDTNRPRLCLFVSITGGKCV
jgi:hypothetical protein